MVVLSEQKALISAFSLFCDSLSVAAALFCREKGTGSFSLLRINDRLVESGAMEGVRAGLPAAVGDVPLFRELGLEKMLALAAREGSPLRREISLPDGRTFQVTVNPPVGDLFPALFEDRTETSRFRTELERCRESFRGLAEDAADLIVRCSWPDGRIEFANDRLGTVLGRGGEDLVGRPLFDLLPEEEVSKVQDEVALLSPEHPLATTSEYAAFLESPMFIEWTYRGFFDEKGSLLRVQALGRDVTERVFERERLRTSEQRFRSLVEDSGACFCEFDRDGVLSYVNGAYARSMGLPVEDLLGYSFYRFIPQEQRGPIREGLASLSPDSPFFTTEHQIVVAGRVVWQRWTNRAFFDDDGSVRSYCAAGYDVTERKESEIAREEQSRHFEALFQKSPIAIAFSRNHQVRMVNPAFCELFRLHVDQVVGKDMREIISSPGRMRHDCGDVVDRMDAGEVVVYDTLRLRGDGTRIPVRIYGVPYEHVSGRGYFTFFQDLGDRLRLEDEIQRNSIVVEESPVVIFEAPVGFGAPCRFISENVSQFGYSAAEVMNGTVSLDERTHPDDMARLREEVALADREGKAFREYTYRLMTRDGRYRWINEKNRLLPGTKDRPARIVGVLIDQTELIEAQMEMESINKALISHARALEESWESTLDLLAGITEMRDPYTRGHQARVADLCRALGEELGFEREPLSELVQAASIHDIGKMEVPSDYLNRPGPLSPEEFEFIKIHPEKGARLLSNIHVPGFFAEIVHQHHERLDGSGYPRGLTGDEILLSARVLAVADVVEAMLSHRPYRPALPLPEVLAHIQEESGRLFEPQVVQACRRLFMERGYVLPEPADFA